MSIASDPASKPSLISKKINCITIMFCAFQGPPRILRLYGQGPDPHFLNTIDFAQTAEHLTLPKGSRDAIIRVKLTRIAYSCGYGNPALRIPARQRHPRPMGRQSIPRPAQPIYRQQQRSQHRRPSPASKNETPDERIAGTSANMLCSLDS